jgi:anthranilate synthase/aminodeoxychorismate synthase-like glutamine amidotransferase
LKNSGKKILVLDNYDSFVYNIVQYVGMQGADPVVYRNDEITLDKIKASVRPDGIIISPGPGHPAKEKDFGVCTDVLKTISKETPTLGICLGHQGIGYNYGAKVSNAGTIVHGKTSRIEHCGKDIFKGIPSPITATRYHSLVIVRESVPEELQVTATSLEDDEIMGIRHVDYPIFGTQFHPESVATAEGMKIIANFLEMVEK